MVNFTYRESKAIKKLVEIIKSEILAFQDMFVQVIINRGLQVIMGKLARRR